MPQRNEAEIRIHFVIFSNRRAVNKQLYHEKKMRVKVSTMVP